MISRLFLFQFVQVGGGLQKSSSQATPSWFPGGVFAESWSSDRPSPIVRAQHHRSLRAKTVCNVVPFFALLSFWASFYPQRWMFVSILMLCLRWFVLSLVCQIVYLICPSDSRGRCPHCFQNQKPWPLYGWHCKTVIRHQILLPSPDLPPGTSCPFVLRRTPAAQCFWTAAEHCSLWHVLTCSSVLVSPTQREEVCVCACVVHACAVCDCACAYLYCSLFTYL